MPLRTRLCEIQVSGNVLLEFSTLEYHGHNSWLIFFFFSSLALSFVSYSSRRGFLFFLSFVRVMWDGRPQLLTYLILFFSLFKYRQIVFSLAFNFVSYSSRCGFLFFLSFVRVMWDGRPQLLTYLFIYFFFLLFKHRQIVFSAFSSVSYSSRCGFLFFLSFVRVMWDGRPQLLTYLIFFLSLFNHRQIVLSQETLS